MTDKIYCGDCIDVMKTMVDQVDFTATSPPYGDSNVGHRTYNGFVFDVDKFADGLFNVTKDGGVCAYIIGDVTVDGSEVGLPNTHCDAFMDLGWDLHDTMIFEKSGLPNPPKNKYYQCWDYMFIFSKGKPNTFHALKDRPNTNAGKPAHWGKITARQRDGSLKEVGKNYITPEFGTRTNIWRYITGSAGMTMDKIAYKHPALFPEMLVRDLILSFTDVGDFVFDPLVGAGTTTKMARLMKRKYMGIDVSKEYVDLAKERTMSDKINFYLPLTADEFNTSLLNKTIERDVF